MLSLKKQTFYIYCICTPHTHGDGGAACMNPVLSFSTWVPWDGIKVVVKVWWQASAPLEPPLHPLNMHYS